MSTLQQQRQHVKTGDAVKKSAVCRFDLEWSEKQQTVKNLQKEDEAALPFDAKTDGNQTNVFILH